MTNIELDIEEINGNGSKFNLPPSIKVGYADYIVTEIEYNVPYGEQDKTPLGETLRVDHQIRISARQNIMEARATFLHEILHAISYIFSVPYGESDEMNCDDGEEGIVSAMSNGLTTVLRDNPLLIEWLNRNFVK